MQAPAILIERDVGEQSHYDVAGLPSVIQTATRRFPVCLDGPIQVPIPDQSGILPTLAYRALKGSAHPGQIGPLGQNGCDGTKWAIRVK